jgi:cyclin A
MDKRHVHDPHYVSEYMKDIMEGLYRSEQRVPREPYMVNQTELSEKMRMILVDWLVEVHIKFKCRSETLFLAVDIVDRYLAVQRTTRSTLQLIGVTAMLLAAKYEDIWPPEVKDCVYISANTYSREDILKTERSICIALQFKLTLPNVQHFLCRLLDVIDATPVTRHLATYFAESSLLSYPLQQCRPSLVASACVMMANVTQSAPEPWSNVLQHYSRHRTTEVTEAARRLLELLHSLTSSRYTAVRRKYTNTKYGDVSSLPLPPMEALH